MNVPEGFEDCLVETKPETLKSKHVNDFKGRE